MKKLYQLLSILLASFSFLGSSAQTTIIDSFLNGGIYRSYRIYIPAINDGVQKVPLVFNLHGLGSNAFEQENYGDFRPIADTANFIIVSPNGTNVVFAFKGWNTFNTIGMGVNDLDFINQLLDTVAKKYPINKDKVYATGMSNGGFMSYELACFMSSKIAAIASVTGSMTEERRTACAARHATPIMQIHGTADKTVGYDGTNYLSSIPAFTHIDSLMKYWIKYNNCSPTAVKTIIPNSSTSDGCTAEHYVWPGGKKGSSVELYKIIDGAHTWPGSSISTGVTNQDFNACKEIWRFFSQYSLDQLSLGITDKNFIKNELSIYPNPAKEFINIKMPYAANAKMSVKLNDLLGKNLYHFESSNGEIQISRNNLPAGIYLLNISTQFATTTHKIILE
jgi:polyhydroxybutyrate depolymerase